MATKKVYIFAGQSNCGRSRFSELSGGQQTTYGGQNTSFSLFNSAFDANALHPLEPGVNTMLENFINANEMGLEVSLAKSLKDDGQTGVFIKCGVGNTDLFNYWSPGGAGELLLKSDVEKTFQLMIAAGDTPVIKAFIWMQGENDATVEAWADAYLSKLQNMFADFNIWLGNKSTELGVSLNTNYVKIIGRINGALDTSEVFRDTVRQAEADFCADGFNNAVLIDTDGYPLRDTVHYSSAGQITFGNDVFAALPDDPTPPPGNNLFTGPNVAVSKVTATFGSAGVNSTNTEIIYLVGNPLKSYIPGRTINGITGFEAGKGYYIITKQNMNLSDKLIPPIE